jgi:phenylacetate-coenzyme A ligase PaaK-like adenylate-forming protein
MEKHFVKLCSGSEFQGLIKSGTCNNFLALLKSYVQTMDIKELQNQIFQLETEEQFNSVALDVFHFQYENNKVYRGFCDAPGIKPSNLDHYSQIPFLPVEFFKKHKVISCRETPSLVFSSSGTTGMQTSRHFVKEPGIYRQSFTNAFELFFGDPEDYHILALLPGYMEREGSSLIYMVNELIKMSHSPHSGFYLDEMDQLRSKIISLRNDERKILLLGVSFALLEIAEKYPVDHPRLMIMETGGMKGRRKEIIREELHDILKNAFSVESICSEYGMTELLSQAYSKGDGIFSTPPWMKVLIRDMNDPFTFLESGKSGGISVIDLANLHSCSFIATQDLGKYVSPSEFQILGRFDSSDIRGCNLMAG